MYFCSCNIFTLSVNPIKNVIQVSRYAKLINNCNVDIFPLSTSSLLCHNDKYMKYLHTSYILSIAHDKNYDASCYQNNTTF